MEQKPCSFVNIATSTEHIKKEFIPPIRYCWTCISVLEGHLSINFLRDSKKQIKIYKNQLILIKPEREYKIIYNLKIPYKSISFRFNLNTKRIQIRHGRYANIDLKIINLQLQQILKEHFYKKEFHKERNDALTVEFLLSLIRLDQGKSRHLNKIVSNKLAESLTVIDNLLGTSEKLTIEDLATISGFSMAYYCRLFKKELGLSPKQYIMEQKLKKATRYLDTSSYSLKDIAFKSGFSDALEFSKYFKKHKGISPSYYRKNINSKILEF